MIAGMRLTADSRRGLPCEVFSSVLLRAGDENGHARKKKKKKSFSRGVGGPSGSQPADQIHPTAAGQKIISPSGVEVGWRLLQTITIGRCVEITIAGLRSPQTTSFGRVCNEYFSQHRCGMLISDSARWRILDIEVSWKCLIRLLVHCFRGFRPAFPLTTPLVCHLQ